MFLVLLFQDQGSAQSSYFFFAILFTFFDVPWRLTESCLQILLREIGICSFSVGWELSKCTQQEATASHRGKILWDSTFLLSSHPDGAASQRQDAAESIADVLPFKKHKLFVCACKHSGESSSSLESWLHQCHMMGHIRCQSPRTARAPHALLTDWHKAVGRPRPRANHRQRLLDEQATTTALALTSSYSQSSFQLSYEIKFIQAEKLEVNMYGCLLCSLQEGPFPYCIL